MEASTSDNGYVQVCGLSKRYGKVQALTELSFAVPRGEMCGIIGPDGAGKTTLFRILATLLLPDGGSATIGGQDVTACYKEIRRQVGYMPGRFSLYGDLTVRENLTFFAAVFGTTVEAHYDMIREIYCRLEPFANRKAAALSGGMKQKLALCCSLIHAPALLLLDEPTTGVDPSSRGEFWSMLKNLRQGYGITVIVSTAYMDEASQCDRVMLLDGGQLLGQGTPQEIICAYSSTLWEVRSNDMYRLLGDLRQVAELEECYTFGATHHVRLAPHSSLTPEALAVRLQRQGHEGIVVRPCLPTMEDCFLYATRERRRAE